MISGDAGSSRMVHGQVGRRGGNMRSERRAARMRDAPSQKGGGRRRETAVEASKQETTDMVARHQADQ